MDGAAWPKARLAISVLTGNCFKKCLSDDRDILFGINSTTADFRYAGYPVSRTLGAVHKVCHALGGGGSEKV